MAAKCRWCDGWFVPLFHAAVADRRNGDYGDGADGPGWSEHAAEEDHHSVGAFRVYDEFEDIRPGGVAGTQNQYLGKDSSKIERQDSPSKHAEIREVPAPEATESGNARTISSCQITDFIRDAQSQPAVAVQLFLERPRHRSRHRQHAGLCARQRHRGE